MKKRENPKSTNKIKKQSGTEFSALNDELGSFGIEPPKIYKSNESKRSSQSKRKTKPQKSKSGAEKNNFSGGLEKPKPKISTQEQRRQQNKKRKQKNKLRKALSIAFVVILALIMLAVLCLTVFFKIDTINITGNSKYTQEQILAVLPIQKDDSLFVANITDAEEHLEQGLPYIYSVEIKKRLPSTINVTIQETTTVYGVENNDKSYTLLDSDLKVLQASASELPKNAILISKLSIASPVEGSPAEISKEQLKTDILQMTAVISKLDLGDKITEIYSSSINSNYMVYDNRITIKLGTTEGLEDKVYSALSVIDEKLNKNNPGAVGTLTATGDKEIYFTEE